VSLVASIASGPLTAASAAPYAPARTENGQPDLQGVWVTEFLTPLERPDGVQHLVATPQQAEEVVRLIRARIPAVIDPDVHIHDIRQLTKVRGEYRTSVIVEPNDGKMPFTAAGLELATAISARSAEQFDAPEQRPLSERCLENHGYAPIRTLRVSFARQIVQGRDHVAIMSEDAVGLRLIHLAGEPPPDAVRSVEGYSRGRWDGDALVATTTQFRADPPARNVLGRPLLIGRNTRITERFTRVSPAELLYRFTVEDADLYTQPWTGELSMIRQNGPIYEYACHEGNYSLANILRGGQAEAARRSAAK
jgi:hypothetical protein